MQKKIVLIKILGFVFLAVGLFSLFCIPAEFTSFYAFMDGGRYHYEGFGFGSLMFAFIILNAMVYLFLALLGIPLGIGNVMLKKWGFNLSLAAFGTLLILGATLIISFLSSFDLLRMLTLYQILTILIFILLFFIVLPYFLIKFYKKLSTEQLFKSSDTESYFEKQSPEKLIIILLNLFWIFVFYLLIFLKGAFPFFGEFIFQREGAYLLSTAIFILLVLTYLFYKDKHYTKYGMMIYYVLLFFTFALTFFNNSTNSFFNLLGLPIYEIEKVVPAFRIPAGVNLGFFFGILIFIQIYLMFRVKNNDNQVVLKR